MTEHDDWCGLADLMASLKFWRVVQETPAPTLGRQGFELLMYEAPFLDGNRVQIPNGPAFARDSEGYREYSILRDPEGFSIRSSGVNRADQFTDNLESWFGSFELAGNIFSTKRVYLYVWTRGPGR